MCFGRKWSRKRIKEDFMEKDEQPPTSKEDNNRYFQSTLPIIETRKMPTLATAFAETTKRSMNSTELSQRVLGLYRKYLRSAPVFVELYELDLPVGVVRTKIRQEFERNRFQKDININNVLLAKGQMEYQELINFWKQQPQVMRYFDYEGDPRFSTDAKLTDSFMGKFLKGY